MRSSNEMESAPVDVNQAWRMHSIAMDAVAESAETVDEQMLRLINNVRAYREAKFHAPGPQEVDFGLVAELCLELELMVREQ